jgi:putative CocE/NonD family hydrolase
LSKLFRVVLFLIFLIPAATFAEDEVKPEAYEIKAHYTKFEYRIPMRDGVKLFTAVYVPKDQSQKYPFLISRTPYSIAPYGADQYPKSRSMVEFWKSGFIMVSQDVRGRFMSEGKFIEENPHIDNKKPGEIDESTDLYDTIDWLLKNIPNNNGRAGMWGISYGGFYTASSMIDTHPALKACSPQAPMINLFTGDDAYHGGAFMLSANFGFYPYFRPQKNPVKPGKFERDGSYGTRDGYDFFLRLGPLAESGKYFNPPNPMWDDQWKHDVYDDYWKVRDLAPHLKDIHCSVLTVGGWFDAEDLYGPVAEYHAIKKQNPGLTNILVEGPWVHGGWAYRDGHFIGNADFGSNTAEYYRKNIAVPFFEHILKDAPDPKLPEAYVFETGSNVWKQYASWPPAEAKPTMLYMQPGGRLSFEAPKSGAEFDEYVSDPAHPVPFIGYQAGVGDVPQEYMASDQRFASRRPDVLVYQSEPLQQDLTIVGPLNPKLFVSTSGTDSDFIVKLIDVYPQDVPEPKEERKRNDVIVPETDLAGFQLLLRGSPLRAKFRNGLEKPEAMTPNKVEEISFSMQDVNHTFKKGHRIMVQVQSSWFPLTDRNPQTFVDIPHAKAEDYVKATERVYHSPQQPSGIQVLVMGK